MRIAKLSRNELNEIKKIEDKLGVVLVAYKNNTAITKCSHGLYYCYECHKNITRKP